MGAVACGLVGGSQGTHLGLFAVVVVVVVMVLLDSGYNTVPVLGRSVSPALQGIHYYCADAGLQYSVL